jgi:acyl carrier protein
LTLLIRTQKTIITGGKEMEKNEIRDRVKQVISGILERDKAEINDNDNLVFDLGASSMQSIQLIAAFEEEFGIEMEQDKAMEVQTVSGAVDFISTCIS